MKKETTKGKPKTKGGAKKQKGGAKIGKPKTKGALKRSGSPLVSEKKKKLKKEDDLWNDSIIRMLVRYFKNSLKILTMSSEARTDYGNLLNSVLSTE